LWNSALVFANGQKDTNLEGEVLPDPLQRRVKLRKGTKQQIIRDAPTTTDEDGNKRFLDPDGDPISGDRVTRHPDTGEKIYGDFQYGHKEDWTDYRNNKRNWGETRKEVIEDQNDHKLYEIDSPEKNQSKGGKKGDKNKKIRNQNIGG